MKKWCKEYDFCIICRKTDKLHCGNGVCISCHFKQRLKNDKKFRKRKQRIVQKAVKKWRLNNYNKSIAHRKVFCALRNGTLKKEPCFCNEKKVHAHHEDYLKPLEIIWLCKKHHFEADILRRRTLLTSKK